MGLEDPSHRREQPLAPGSTPNEPGLITGRLLLSVLCLRWSAKLEWPLQVQAWAEDMEILVCPVARIPLSALLVGSDGKDEPIRSVPAQLQELPEGFTLFHQPPTGLHSGFSVRVYSHSLRFSQSNHKAVVVLRQVVLGYRVPVAGKRCTWPDSSRTTVTL